MTLVQHARRASAVFAALAVCAFVAAGASAAAYPERPIRMIVPFASGSNIDITARQIMPKFSEQLGQQVVVDNRGGAGGTIGAALAAKAAPDGYTLLMGNAPTHGLAPSMYRDLPYDPVKSFTPIVRISTQSFVLAITSTLPVKSVAELVKYAKARPRQLNYASSGNGTTAHLSGALFNVKAGVELVHIPYNTVPQALIDLGGGSVSVMFYPYQPLMPMIQQGRVRLLASTGPKRLSYLPELPTVIEAGISDFTAFAWHGFYAPAGTPKPIVDRLYKELAAIVAMPEFKTQMDANGAEPIASKSPEEFREMLRGQVDKYVKITKAIGIKLD